MTISIIEVVVNFLKILLSKDGVSDSLIPSKIVEEIPKVGMG